MVVLIAAATTARAQTQMTLGLASSRITTAASNASNGRPDGHSGPAVNFVADGRSETRIESTMPARDDEFEFIRGSVIAAPEPTTMLLFGSVLLLIAGIIRRRMRLPKATRYERRLQNENFSPGSWSPVSMGAEQGNLPLNSGEASEKPS